MRASAPVVQPGQVRLRHVKRGASTDAGARKVLDSWFTPQDSRGVNGDGGFVSGNRDWRLNEESSGTVAFPNGAGSDGQLHRRRFDALTDDDYAPGEEWVEVYWGDEPRPYAVLTPKEFDLQRPRLDLDTVDGFWTLLAERETAAGVWHHAPRDVIEHYLGARTLFAAEDFDGTPPFSYSTGQQTTSDGKWEYTKASAAGGKLTLTGGPAGAPDGTIFSTREIGFRRDHAQHHGRNRCVRAEALVSMTATSAEEEGYLEFGFSDRSAVPSWEVKLQVGSISGVTRAYVSGGGVSVSVKRQNPTKAAVRHLAVEIRGPWAWFYLDGNLLGVLPSPDGKGGAGPDTFAVFARVSPLGNFVVSGSVDHILVRELKPHLLRHPTSPDDPPPDRGDYHLPGVPPPGGLRARYYADADLATEQGGMAAVAASAAAAGTFLSRALSPVRVPYAERVDVPNFAAADPPAWQPAGTVAGDWFSARFTGAIYLNLAANDMKLRVTLGENNPSTTWAAPDDAARLWVGKTMWGDQLIDKWAGDLDDVAAFETGWLRAHLARPDGVNKTGWFPIVLEYAHLTGLGGVKLEYALASAPSTWAAVPDTWLSPFGVYDGSTRYEPHYELVKNIASTFGLQFRSDPRSLESGEFPCVVRPRVRVGRDTDYVLESDEAVGIQRKGNSEQVVETLVGDAQGVARDDQAQLTAERVDFARIGTNAFIHTDHESLSDITSAPLLQQRLDSLLALRGGPWEEVNAQPAGVRELRDTFPLTGQLAEFAWEPGDGLRLKFDELDVEDLTARQIMGAGQGFVPGGLGAMTASFRQRSRNLREMLRRIQRAHAVQGRHYQGQVTVIAGSLGVANGGVDPYSRVTLPASWQQIVAATLTVHTKTAAANADIYLNDALALAAVSAPGKYDVTAAAQAIALSTERGIAAHMMGAAVTAGETIGYVLDLTVVI
jgi:hypothetical protein